MMRVPGSRGNLIEAKARGADVRFVYSPLDALKIAVDNPDKQVVFFAVGFETTAPSTAVTLVRARQTGVTNFSIFCNHVTIVPPIKAILESPDLRLSGFLGPGHVSTVVGLRPYRFVPEVYGKPMVVAGFEPLDILASVHMLLQQIRDGRCEVENQYIRVVRPEGNTQALKLMSETFALRPHFEWRGLGFISQSALKIHPDYAEFDAEERFSMPGVRVADPKACQCGEVLKGVIKPWECKVFGTACTRRPRSARAWCRRRGRARRTTTSGACTGRRRCWWVGEPSDHRGRCRPRTVRAVRVRAQRSRLLRTRRRGDPRDGGARGSRRGVGSGGRRRATVQWRVAVPGVAGRTRGHR